jgi:hypothetical protein
MLQPYLAEYDYVWLLDEDLSFAGFDYNGFMSVLMLAYSNGPPLIAQPVLYKPGENGTLYYNEQLHSKHCSRKLKDPWFWIDGNRTSTAAALVAFVELQGPILDAAFFDWFLTEVCFTIISIFKLCTTALSDHYSCVYVIVCSSR